MKVLVIAPYPPPHTGNSLPIKVLCDKLVSDGHELEIIKLNKKEGTSGVVSFSRLSFILSILYEIAVKNKKFDGQEFKTLGWTQIQWSEEINAYKPKAAIDAIQYFRLNDSDL